MVTNGEFVSRVVNGLKALSKDMHVSARYIAHIGKVKAKFLMSQKLDEMTLFKEDAIITSVNCFRLKRIKSKDCGIVEFNLCDNIMKSCEKIPEGLFGKNGSSIVSVLSVDGSKEYNYITPRKYVDIKKRKYRSKTAGYYYIQDGYMYLPDSKNELVDLTMIVLDKDEAELVSDCSGNGTNKPNCKSKLESEFVCPDRFLDLVLRDTIAEIGNFYRTSVQDENPNLDVNQKSKTVQ
jgi:hypothetical protein